jgi:hypothetical protein
LVGAEALTLERLSCPFSQANAQFYLIIFGRRIPRSDRVIEWCAHFIGSYRPAAKSSIGID